MPQHGNKSGKPALPSLGYTSFILTIPHPSLEFLSLASIFKVSRSIQCIDPKCLSILDRISPPPAENHYFLAPRVIPAQVSPRSLRLGTLSRRITLPLENDPARHRHRTRYHTATRPANFHNISINYITHSSGIKHSSIVSMHSRSRILGTLQSIDETRVSPIANLMLGIVTVYKMLTLQRRDYFK